MEISEQLKLRVMRRVYGIWFFRRVLPWIALEGALLAAIGMLLRSRIFVAAVLDNTVNAWSTSGFVRIVDFMVYAYMHTNIVVQVSLAGAAAIVAILSWEFLRSIRHALMIARSEPLSRNLLKT